jgi:hypothetical protein
MEKQCDNCGATFACNPGACWCNQFKLDEAQLTRIGQKFEDCLCAECLTTLTLKSLNG